jgi:hypothetical protein
MFRPALLLLPILFPALVAGCAGATPRGERDTTTEACRAEAERMVLRRERAQVMRADETESGRDSLTVAPYSRAQNDRAFAQEDRNRIIAECMRANPRAGTS